VIDGRCSNCRHAVADPGELEREIVGFAILSSALGSTAGETALCRRHGYFVSRSGACDVFEPSVAPVSAHARAGPAGFGKPP
jgi:hypothetical protein